MQKGFSLTEMSVVIVIIAILAAAILGGQNLVEGARIRQIVSEVSEHKISVNGFLAKYQQYPGDFSEAVAFWGAGTNDDGNSNGQIEFKNSDDAYEGYRAWQHLSYAGMINEAMVGTQTTSAAVIGSDVPTSAAKGGAYFMEYDVFGLGEVNALVLGAPVATASAPILVNGVLTPSQALEVDRKIDNDNPSTGKVHALDGNGSAAESCVDDPSDDGANSEDFYKIAVSGKDCAMGFSM